MGLFDMFKKKSAEPEVPLSQRYTPAELVQQAQACVASNNYVQAEKLMLAAAECGEAQYLFQTGRFYESRGGLLPHVGACDFPHISWYRKAGEQGHLEAIRKLAEHYHFGWMKPDAQGDFVEYKDNPEAAVWYQKGSDLGDVDMTLTLATIYLLGEEESDMMTGIPKNEAKARDLYIRAYELGHKESAYDIALLYRYDEQEDPQPVDPKLAFEYFMIAAQQDNDKRSDAQWEIGFMYEEGIYVEKNQKEAAYWYLMSGADENGEYPD